MSTPSFYRPVPTRDHMRLREVAFKARRMEGIRCIDETPQKKMERSISEGDMRCNNRKVCQRRN